MNWKNNLRYYFENTISSGPIAVIKWLAIISFVSIFIIGLLIVIFGISDDPEGNPLNLLEAIWQSLMATLDSGTMGGDVGWPFRVLRFGATLVGIFVISMLIGIISSGIDEKLEELKKGKSFVIEKNHTLIIGWSNKIFSIIEEIIEANANQRNQRIVIVADRDKVEMEDEIKSKNPNTKLTKFIKSKNPNSKLTKFIKSKKPKLTKLIAGEEEGLLSERFSGVSSSWVFDIFGLLRAEIN